MYKYCILIHATARFAPGRDTSIGILEFLLQQSLIDHVLCVTNDICHLEHIISLLYQDLNSLVDLFTMQLKTVKEKIVIFFDSLDQLPPREHGGAVGWLPKKLLGNVKIVVSSLPGEEFNILPALKVSFFVSLNNSCIYLQGIPKM